jgi:hypothetical protein
MYIDDVPNRKSPPAILLRESRREGKRTVKRTVANMTHWPADLVAVIRRAVKGEALVSPHDLWEIERSLPHGHVEAVLGTVRRLGMDGLIAAKPCRERNLVVALLVERLIHPASKLATVRLWKETTLAQALDVQDATVEEIYRALDWLLARQARIETKLAKRHLAPDGLVLYDVSSSSYQGHACPLAVFGHNRDGQDKLPCIVYGLLADVEGRPVSVQVYPGNTGDPTTVPDQVEKVREQFGLSHVILVGDRGMLTQTRIDTLRQYPGLGWLSALRSEAIRTLMDTGCLSLSAFEHRTLAEIASPDFPGERLFACFNEALAGERKRTRDELLAETEKDLQKIVREAARRTHTPLTDADIGVKVGKAINRHKVAKHFAYIVENHGLQFKRKTDAIRREAELDGIYVIRTGESAQRIGAHDAVRGYKNLAQVERAFRCIKGIDVRVRPIFHHTPDHVRAHIFLCMLAYYVDWHIRRAWAPLLFADESLPQTRRTRDPVAPADISPPAKKKKTTRRTDDGFEVQSFDSLMTLLGTRCQNLCRIKTQEHQRFTQFTQPTPLQKRALELLGLKT